jgi:CRP/FNR family transcriptional regulator
MNCASGVSAIEHFLPRPPTGLHPVQSACLPLADNFFWSISPESRAAFDKIKHTSTFPSHTVIFVEGQSAGGVFVLGTGRAKLSTCSVEGRTMILRIADCGEVLGLHASITGLPHAMTVATMQPSTLDFVSRENLMTFLRGHGDAALRVTQILSHECMQAYELARRMGLSQSVSERLARFLLETGTHGQMKDGRVHARMALTHEEISQVVGTSRETITRLLSEFKKRGVVELKGSMLTICNRQALESMGRAN